MKTFKLVTLDLDYTIFLGNSVTYLNKLLRISRLLDQYHADYRDGKISEKELNDLQTPILEKVSVSKSIQLLSKGPILKNLDKGLRILRDADCNVQMLTLNPLQLAFKELYGVGAEMSLFAVNGDNFRLEGSFPENKVELLERYCIKNRVEISNCVHVGDSHNDVEAFRRVGYSIALNSSDKQVQKEASASLKTEDFLDVANTLLRANDLA